MAASVNLTELISRAERRIRPYIRETPVLAAPDWGTPGHCQVFLKLENEQITGSFKLRGALNKLLHLDEAGHSGPVIAASTGNHGLAVAHGASLLNRPAIVYLPEDAAPHKVDRLRGYGVTLRFVGQESSAAEAAARRESERTGAVFISPYNDWEVVAGQGSIGIELFHQVGQVDAVFVAVGGGGLIGGIAAAIKERNPAVQIVGCVPERSPVMYASIRAGQIVSAEVRPTLSDGTAGGIEPGAITFDLCRQLVDRWVVVSEEAIRASIRRLYTEHGLVVEGAAGVAAAGYLHLHDELCGRRAGNVALVLCGGNIDPQLFRRIVTGVDDQEGGPPADSQL